MSQTTAQTTRPDSCNFTGVLPDDAANSLSFGLGFTHDLGDRCGSCEHTEAHCARTGRCCDKCSHAFASRLPAQHGSERAYQAHWRRRDPACPPCLAAHARHNREHRP